MQRRVEGKLMKELRAAPAFQLTHGGRAMACLLLLGCDLLVNSLTWALPAGTDHLRASVHQDGRG